jgi:predicted exporter
MSPHLLENERSVSAVTGFTNNPTTFIVAGDTEQALLENEERLRVILNPAPVFATSLFLPSVSAQKQNYLAAARLLPLAEHQFAALGFSRESQRGFVDDFSASRDMFVTMDKELPATLKDVLSSLWIGAIDGTYYSCVTSFVSESDKETVISAVSSLDNVFLSDRVGGIEKNLNALTKTMFCLYAVAYGIIALFAKCLYPWRNALKICALPLVSGLAIAAVNLLFDIPIGFFTVVAFLLVFGLGLDYIFYMLEDKSNSSPLPAVIFSWLTTALSFGALTFSHFAPVHIFGITVLTGLSAAFITAILLGRRNA